MTRNYGVIANGSAQPATASTSTVLAATHAASSVRPTSSSGPPITEKDASTRKNQRSANTGELSGTKRGNLINISRAIPL